MRRRNIFQALSSATACGILGLTAVVAYGQDLPQSPNADQADSAAGAEAGADAEAQAEVMTHGPVHEAFAGPVASVNTDGMTIPEAPPEPIDELPPEAMPEGENVEWIPGYWGWDEDREDFIWISGLWRNVPPDQRWVPGYWATADSGNRWVSGFWTGVDNNNLDYLPYPPESQEQGPNVPAPDANHFWVPGSWVYASNDYQWQPGYWAPAHDDWCWIPQRYTWTPRGVLYSDGYWDYRLPQRGTLFAPVYFGNRGYYRGGRRFSPGYAINPAGLLVNLFVRPSYRHYYFGDYYGQQFQNRGFRPWYNASYGNRYQYDPLLAFYESYYDRRGVDFSGRIDNWHQFYDRNPNRRPPRTLQDTIRFANDNRDDADASQLILARSLRDLTGSNVDGQQRFRNLSSDQRTAMSETATQIRELAQNRGRVEVEADASARGEARADTDLPNANPNERPNRNPNADNPQRGRNNAGGLQLPEVTRPNRGPRGEGAPERGRDATDADRPNTDRPNTDRPNANRPNPNVPDTNRPNAETPGADDARQRGQNGDQPRRGNRPDLPERPSASPNRSPQQGRGDTPDAAQNPGQRGNQGQPQAPSRNMLQPRRGNIPETQQGNQQQGQPQRPQVDPREAIPNFRGNRGAGQPGNVPGQRGGANRGPQGGQPPAAGNRGPQGGNAPAAGNRGGGKPPAAGNSGGGNKGGGNKGDGKNKN